MENTSNISSEEELSELRNEGKISKAEYQDLLSAIRKPRTELDKDELPGDIKERWYWHTNIAGIVSIIISLAGLLYPLPHIVYQPKNVNLSPCFWFTFQVEIVACALGFVSWKTKFGKVGATISSIAIICTIPFLEL